MSDDLLEVSAEEYSVFFQWTYSAALGWPTTPPEVRARLDAVAGLANVKSKTYPGAPSRDRAPGRLRIGYLSADFHEHATPARSSRNALPGSGPVIRRSPIRNAR